MVLYFIGLGLGDETDITLKGLNTIKRSFKVYLESYTSILSKPKTELESFYGREVIEADRIFVESQCEQMLEEAKTAEVSFLVVGDPFCATTHADLFLRAQELKIKVEVIHNASIFTAVGLTGLQLYKFGETVSIPFFTENWRPYSFYEKILKNRERNLHTLVLLDIKVKEQSEEDMIRGRMVFQPPRFMTADQAAEQLVEVSGVKGGLSESELVFAVMRMGCVDQRIVVKSLGELRDAKDLGPPLHSMVIPAELDEIERSMMDFHLGNSK